MSTESLVPEGPSKIRVVFSGRKGERPRVVGVGRGSEPGPRSWQRKRGVGVPLVSETEHPAERS